MRGTTARDLDRVFENPNNQEGTRRRIVEGFLGDYFEEIELATELGITRRTLRRWHNERRGPVRTVCGRRVLYRKESVIAWLLAREERALPRRSR